MKIVFPVLFSLVKLKQKQLPLDVFLLFECTALPLYKYVNRVIHHFNFR